MATDLAALTNARILYGRELLSVLKQNLFFGKYVSRRFSQTGNNINGIVRVPSVTVPPVQFRTKGQCLTVGDTAVSYIDVVLDKHMVVPMTLDSLDVIFSDIDFRRQMATRAAYNIAEGVEGLLAGLYTEIPNYVGNASTTAWADTSKAIAAIQVLDNNKAPSQPRYGALSSGSKASALGNPSFTQYNTAGPASTLVSGDLGERFGIMWGLSQGVKTHTGGGATAWGSALVNNSPGPYAIGTTSIAIDGGGAAGALKAGDSFILDGNYYALDADATLDGAGAGTITITPPLKTAVANNAPLTIGEGVKTGVQNIIFLPEAFALATAPMDDARPGTESNLVTDEQTGLSIRVTYSYDHLCFAHIFTTELLAGVKLVRPEFAVRMVSST